MYQNIRLLSDLSYAIGLIGLSEYIERSEIIDWLEDDANHLQDPRIRREDKFDGYERESQINGNDLQGKDSSLNRVPSSNNKLEFLLLNKWMFTIGDRDCYPSVPHGHLYKKTNEWPKLNPYTGRAFLGMHNAQHSLTLSKLEMKMTWNNLDFVEHCRKQVLWYSNFAVGYDFPSARFGKLVFPKWK
jgi:hypothetical protein